MNSNLEEFDRQKTKVFKYIIYKKRTEYEVRNKFKTSIEENMLEDIIDYLKEAGYIDDRNYIKRAIQDFMTLKKLSIKEIRYKLSNKGISRNLIEDYMNLHEEELKEYEEKCKQTIIEKKSSTMTEEEIKNYLMKKGYKI